MQCYNFYIVEVSFYQVKMLLFYIVQKHQPDFLVKIEDLQ